MIPRLRDVPKSVWPPSRCSVLHPMAARPLPSPGPATPPTPTATVHVTPGMSADTVLLTTYRHDGRAFLRIELPADLAPEWVPYLRKYTVQHDDSKPAPMRLVV